MIHHSVLVQEDQHSRQVATSAMQALVPAWLGAGRPAQGLWEAIVKALPKVAAPRRLHLLSSLLAAMPQVRFLLFFDGLLSLLPVKVEDWCVSDPSDDKNDDES